MLLCIFTFPKLGLPFFPVCLGQSWFTRVLVQLFIGLPFILKSVVGENYCASLIQYAFGSRGQPEN